MTPNDKSATDTLEIIEKQIEKLKAQDKLDLPDVRRLDVLVKLRQLILGKPTEISESRESQEYTDKEVLDALKKKKKTKANKG